MAETTFCTPRGFFFPFIIHMPLENNFIIQSMQQIPVLGLNTSPSLFLTYKFLSSYGYSALIYSNALSALED